MRFQVLLPLVLATGGWLHANLIQNGSFETTAISGPYSIYATGDTTSLDSWTVTGATCGTNCVLGLPSTYTEGALAFQPQDGNQSMDLTGAFNTLDGGLMQVVSSLVAGQHYTLTFWVGNQDNAHSNYPLASSLVVLLDGVAQGTFTNNDSTPNQVTWEQMSLDFTAASSNAAIEFRNATASADNYVGLDNVSLEAAGEVPEPATFALIGGALVALAYRKRRSN